jgi:hypothetical protein
MTRSRTIGGRAARGGPDESDHKRRRPTVAGVLEDLERSLDAAEAWPAAHASRLLLALVALAAPTRRAEPFFARLLASGDPRVFADAHAAGLGELFHLDLDGLGDDTLDRSRSGSLPALLAAGAHQLAVLFHEPPLATSPSSPASPPPCVAALLALGIAHERLLARPTGAADTVSLAPPDPLGATSFSRRRQWGSHYTPWPLARAIVERALLHERLPARPLVCDPAMGGGVFLLAAATVLAERLACPVAEVVPLLHGIDRDVRAVDVARYALHAYAGAPDDPVDRFGARLVQADALLDPVFDGRWSPPPRAPEATRLGFDLIVGNPPFVGGKRIATHLGRPYAAKLRQAFPGVSGNTDLCALFVRRAYENTHPDGAVGLVATSAIAKGATRENGLSAICRDGATLVEVERARPWPGDAAVHISVLHFVKGLSSRQKRLDGAPVAHISPFLEDAPADEAPPRRPANEGLAFVGCYLRGMGFTFDDTNPAAMPLARRDELLRRRPELASRLRPYLGGEEVARHPEQAPHRFALDLNDLTLDDEPRFPELFSLARRYVKPARDRLSRETAVNRGHQSRFFAWANARPELQRAVRGLPRMLVTPRISTHRFFAFLPTDVVPSEQLVVFALASDGAFAVLSSVVHEVWARAFGSTQGVGLRYTPSDVFETFPLPDRPNLFDRLAPIGKELYEFRRAHLLARQCGLSELYAQLDRSPELAPLRELHRRLDGEVLEAFGLPAGLAREVRRGPGSDRTEGGKRIIAHLRRMTDP